MHIPPDLVNEHFNDRYFDVVDALVEARLIYLEQCKIMDFFSSFPAKEKPFIIGETGFGAGRLFIALLDYLDKSGINGISVVYNSVELYPLSPQRMLSILKGFRFEVGPLISQLVDAYRGVDISLSGWQSLRIDRPFGTVILNLFLGEALDMVTSIMTPCNAWFLDGHGPKKNPSIWREELLYAIGTKTVKNGICASYSVAGHVRRALENAGFAVERLPGFGGKKSVMRGIKVH